MKTDIQRDIYEETLRKFNAAAAKGIAESGNENISDTFLEKIRQGNEIFSAFRTHRMQNEIAARLLDGRGRLKPFDRWKQDVKGITNHFVGPWLKTEYKTAVIRAHQAADWQHFINEADVYPNVRWMPTTSPNQDPLHRQYWESRLTLPIGHPFWDEHHPGDRWNCKCSLKQTDEPTNDNVIKDFYPVKPQKGLENNPGKDGSLFSDSHSYFPDSCSKCEFYRNANKGFKNRMTIAFSNRQKNCFGCPYALDCINELEDTLFDIINVDGGGKIKISKLVNREDNDFATLLEDAYYFAGQGKAVLLPPKMTRPAQFAYDRYYSSLKGTPYYGKCPDLYIDGVWYEHEGFTTINPKKALRNMLHAGGKQCERLIIDKPDLTDSYIKRIIGNKVALGDKIKEVWLKINKNEYKRIY